MKRAVLVLAVIGSMAGISGSTAELDPPWRGAPGSTYQEWRFDNNANPAAPDLKTNVASAAQAEITLGAFAAGWQQQLPGLGSATGYWDLGSNGSIRLGALSALAPAGGEYQYISLQVVQWFDGGIYSAIAEVTLPGADLLDRAQMESQGDSCGGWLVDRTLCRLSTAQALDSISIQGAQQGAIIDRILLETQTFMPACPSNLVVTTDPGHCSRSNVVWS